MRQWPVQALPLRQHHYEELEKFAKASWAVLIHKRKRRPYIRSAYFQKQKVFLEFFWPHLFQKPLPQRKQRLKLLPCAIELIEKSMFEPEEKRNPIKQSEVLFRFFGITPQKQKIIVQLKRTPRGALYFISVFPWK